MAEKRMFAKTIVLSDEFLDMPMSARCLYFTLGMVADDDGFVNAPKSIMRQIGASTDDMNILISKNYVLVFESGVVVIKHWRINNLLRKDRYTPTKYVEEKNKLQLKSNGSYTKSDIGIPIIGIPSIDKESIDKDNNYILSSENEKLPKIEETFNKADSNLSDIKVIIDYLNKKANRNFRYDTASTVKHINARLNKGYTVDDFKLVVDLKVKQWLNDKNMSKYLRPETLFSPSHFESYLNEIPKKTNKKVSNELDKIF